MTRVFLYTYMLLALVCAVPALAADVDESIDQTCPPYDRREWPHWIRQESTGMTTRDMVLQRDGAGVVVENHKVVAGTWVDPYAGGTITNPKKVDIDHVVPLKWAHDHGGCHWDRARKKAYANNLDYFWALRAVSPHENQREKGARGPADYTPPLGLTQCQYGQAFATVVTMEGLTIGERDRQAIRELVATCGK